MHFTSRTVIIAAALTILGIAIILAVQPLPRRITIIPEITYCYPLERYGRLIGSPYSGTHALGNWQSDNAIDIEIPFGTKVIAVEGGVIGSRIGSLGKGGRYAGLRLTLEGITNSYYYAHLSSLAVHAGQRVKAGQILGRSNFPGTPHLHLGVRQSSPYDVGRSLICKSFKWTAKKRWLWLRWYVGEGKFKKYGKHNSRYRPKVLPDEIPRFIWLWTGRWIKHNQMDSK